MTKHYFIFYTTTAMTPEKNKNSQEVNWESISLPKGANDVLKEIKDRNNRYKDIYNREKKDILYLLEWRDFFVWKYKNQWKEIFKLHEKIDFFSLNNKIKNKDSKDYDLEQADREIYQLPNLNESIETLSNVTEIIAKFWVDKIDWKDNATFTHDGMWSSDLQVDVNWSRKELKLWKDYWFMNLWDKRWYIESKRDILEKNEWIIQELCKLSPSDRKKYFDNLRRPINEYNWSYTKAHNMISSKKDLLDMFKKSIEKKDIKQLIEIKDWGFMYFNDELKSLLKLYKTQQRINKKNKSIAQLEQQDKDDADDLLKSLDEQVA